MSYSLILADSGRGQKMPGVTIFPCTAVTSSLWVTKCTEAMFLTHDDRSPLQRYRKTNFVHGDRSPLQSDRKTIFTSMRPACLLQQHVEVPSSSFATPKATKSYSYNLNNIIRNCLFVERAGPRRTTRKCLRQTAQRCSSLLFLPPAQPSCAPPWVERL